MSEVLKLVVTYLSLSYFYPFRIPFPIQVPPVAFHVVHFTVLLFDYHASVFIDEFVQLKFYHYMNRVRFKIGTGIATGRIHLPNVMCLRAHNAAWRLEVATMTSLLALCHFLPREDL